MDEIFFVTTLDGQRSPALHSRDEAEAWAIEHSPGFAVDIHIGSGAGATRTEVFVPQP